MWSQEGLLADVTGDGLLDLLFVTHGPPEDGTCPDFLAGVVILENLGSRAFADPRWAVSYPSGHDRPWVDLALGDVDQDEDPDLFVHQHNGDMGI